MGWSPPLPSRGPVLVLSPSVVQSQRENYLSRRKTVFIFFWWKVKLHSVVLGKREGRRSHVSRAVE